MINGAHMVIYSTDPSADRAFFKDVLGLGHVDVGGGWLIFGLPPSEIAVHPHEANDLHHIFLMCEDIDAFVTQITDRGVEAGDIKDEGWGRVVTITLPGGGKLGVYQPRHERPDNA